MLQSPTGSNVQKLYLDPFSPQFWNFSCHASALSGLYYSHQVPKRELNSLLTTLLLAKKNASLTQARAKVTSWS